MKLASSAFVTATVMASLSSSSSSSLLRQQMNDFLCGRASSLSTLPADDGDDDDDDDDNDIDDASSNQYPELEPPDSSLYQNHHHKQQQDAATHYALLRARLDRLAVLMRTTTTPRTLCPEDFDGGAMRIADDIHFPADLAPEVADVWRKRVRLVEREARFVAEEFCREFEGGGEGEAGYEENMPIVRIAVREFYTSILKRYQETCFPPDPRGQRTRNTAQEICVQAIDRHVWLNQFEKGLLARAGRCPPHAAENFWRYTFQHRLNFLALKDVVDLQRQRQGLGLE